MIRQHTNRRGTAMAETVLALPFLMLILLFILYFGRSSVRVERTHIMDRYDAWRQAGHGPGPHPDDTRGHPQMNDTWFNENATAIGHTSHGSFPDEAPLLWLDRSGQRTDDAGLLATEMWEQMARGRTARFTTRQDTSNIFLERFNGDIHASHTVQDHDWKFVNGFRHRAGPWDARGPHAHNLSPLRDLFYEAFDSTLEGMSDTQNPLASTIRGLYLDIPGYAGPKVQ